MAKYRISQEELGSWSETSVYYVEAGRYGRAPCGSPPHSR